MSLNVFGKAFTGIKREHFTRQNEGVKPNPLSMNEVCQKVNEPKVAEGLYKACDWIDNQEQKKSFKSYCA